MGSRFSTTPPRVKRNRLPESEARKINVEINNKINVESKVNGFGAVNIGQPSTGRTGKIRFNCTSDSKYLDSRHWPV